MKNIKNENTFEYQHFINSANLGNKMNGGCMSYKKDQNNEEQLISATCLHREVQKTTFSHFLQQPKCPGDA